MSTAARMNIVSSLIRLALNPAASSNAQASRNNALLSNGLLETAPPHPCALAVMSSPRARITASMVFNVGLPCSLKER